MNEWFYNLLKPFALKLLSFGFDLRTLKSFSNYPRFRRQKKNWIKMGGKISKNYMILTDYKSEAGTSKGHYFHQDLLVAKFILEHNPKRHLDIGSRIDGFVAHVAIYRQIEVMDIRPLPKSEHSNIKFIQADMMSSNKLKKTDSLSCLHAIEHFGLGRYNDNINVNGHIEGINNLVNLVEKGGRLYISFPIGPKDEVFFNAHRVFHPLTIFNIESIKNNMSLQRFDYVDDNGSLHKNFNINNVRNVKFGCGIYTFVKN